MTPEQPIVFVLAVSARDRDHLADLLDQIGAATPDDGPAVGQIVEHVANDGFAFQSLQAGSAKSLGDVIDHLRTLRRPL